MVGKDIPNITYGSQKDYKKLYYQPSDPGAALKADITIMAGYGLLPMGFALAKNTSNSSSNKNKLLPYDPTLITGQEVAPSRAYLTSDSPTTDNYMYVTIDDSYKFIVGDDVIIVDDTTAEENLGAVTAIDVTTYTNRAKITVTTNIGGTSFTTARFAHVSVEGRKTCVGILEKSVDAGTGSTAAGALATVILSNAQLYTGMLTNFDAAAISDLSATSFGRFTLLK